MGVTWALRGGGFGNVVKAESECFFGEFDGASEAWGKGEVALGAYKSYWSKGGSVVV